MKAVIILANGFEDIEALGTVALLRRGGIDLDIATIEDGDPTGKYGVTVAQTMPLSQIDPDRFELLILPGGPGYQRLLASSQVKAITEDFYAKQKFIAAICAAPTILGHFGMLKGRNYTCFPGMQEESFGGNYQEEKAVADGNIITGKAAGAVTDFALMILARTLGEETAQSVKNHIYF